MNNNKTKQQRAVGLPHKARRPLIFVFFGVFLIGLGSALMNMRLQDETLVDSTIKPLSYNIQQSVNTQPHYKQTSFFSKTPDATNTAFITGITDAIEAQFNYTFTTDETTDLSYRHQTIASIRALYGTDRGTEGAMSTVWSKQFVLSEPVVGKRSDRTLSLNPIVRIPFAEYKKQMEQFRNTFSTPTTGEMIVTHTVQLTGNVNGAQIKETKISTVSAPLDQQVYELTSQFEKTTKKEVIPENKKASGSLVSKLELPAAIALIVAGLACTIYGFRKQKIKSPHQRELEKIYRYHDGIIIRAKHPPELENKNIVNIKSFDDMLNLEEELKTPIIASKISDYTTHFFITRDDIVYVHTLGIPVPFKNTSSISEDSKT